MKPESAVRFDRTLGRLFFYRLHRWVYRISGGRIWAKSALGPILLLTTTGRKSGQPRQTALLCMPDGDGFYVVGSNGGRPETPAWLLNLGAQSSCRVQYGRRRFAARAEILEGAAREAAWPRLTEFYPGWAHYQTLTDRTIYPVHLTPAGSAAP